MVPSCINDLPEELLRKIFDFLSPLELKRAMLVCMGWKVVGEDSPALWTWVWVTLNSKKDLGKLSIKRMEGLQNITVGRKYWTNDVRKLFQVLNILPKLVRIDGLNFVTHQFTVVDKYLLASVLSSLVELNLNIQKSNISCEQVEEILLAITRRHNSLKKLTLFGWHGAHPGGWSRLNYTPVSNIEEVRLGGSILSSQQMTALLEIIVQERRLIKKLTLDIHGLAEIDSALIGTAFNKLEAVSVMHWLSQDQMKSIFRKLLETNSRLMSLSFSFTYEGFVNYCGEIDVDLVRKVEGRIGPVFWKKLSVT